MTYHVGNGEQTQKIQINQKASDVIPVFGGLNTRATIKPKGYNDYTKKFDNNYLKIGLR